MPDILTVIKSDTVASQLNSDFDNPVMVVVMMKLALFPFLQSLGFAGQLGSAVETFHGLDDFFDQITTYSAANVPALMGPYGTIQARIPLNPIVTDQTYDDPELGTVGTLFQTMGTFGMVFGINPDDVAKNVAAATVGDS